VNGALLAAGTEQLETGQKDIAREQEVEQFMRVFNPLP
jgi:hypothetical protein